MDFFLIILKTLPYVFVFLPPFAFAGLILGTLLSAPSYPTGRIYFSDLVDSGFGAFVVIPAISRLGLEECLLLTCALFVAGSLFCYRPKGAPSRIAMGAAIVLLVIATVKKRRSLNCVILPIRCSPRWKNWESLMGLNTPLGIRLGGSKFREFHLRIRIKLPTRLSSGAIESSTIRLNE